MYGNPYSLNHRTTKEGVRTKKKCVRLLFLFSFFFLLSFPLFSPPFFFSEAKVSACKPNKQIGCPLFVRISYFQKDYFFSALKIASFYHCKRLIINNICFSLSFDNFDMITIGILLSVLLASSFFCFSFFFLSCFLSSFP